MKKITTGLLAIATALSGALLGSQPASASPAITPFVKVGENPASPFSSAAMISAGVSGSKLASSADGTRLLTAETRHFNGSTPADSSDVLYQSVDSGRTWVALNTGPIGEWSVVASSSSGRTLAAASYGTSNSDGKIWVSSNGGISWTQAVIHDRLVNSDPLFWWDLDMTSDGTQMVAGLDHSNVPFRSLDGGLNWYPITGFPLSANYRNVAVANDGSRVFLCDNSLGLRIANHSLATVTEAHFAAGLPLPGNNGNCGAFAIDGAGTKALLGSYTGNQTGLYKSVGNAWTLDQVFDTEWRTGSASLSDDGQVIVIGATNADSYISLDGGATFVTDWSLGFRHGMGWFGVQPNGSRIFAFGDDGFYEMLTGVATAVRGAQDSLVSTPSNSANTPAPYLGPILSAIANRNVNSVTGGLVSITGRQLTSIRSVEIAGSKLVSTLKTDWQIDYIVPGGKPGEAMLVIVFDSGRMTWANAFAFVDPSVAIAALANRQPTIVKKVTKVKAKAKAKPKPKK